MKDFIIVGGGIAGLAIAELLQRSGRDVLLLERGAQLCGGASSRQQGWFHTGALYAALPNSNFLRILAGNVDDLLRYYEEFPRMNLRKIDGRLSTMGNGWFSNTTNFYAYVDPSELEIPLWMGIPWRLAIHKAIRKTAALENARTRAVVGGWVDTLDLGKIHTILKSRDRSMDTWTIAMDLTQSFLTNGGDVRLSAPVEQIGRGVVVIDKGPLYARHIIDASGGSFNDHASKVCSPMLAVYPALTTVNFVRMTPRQSQTINHVYHRDFGGYSLFATAQYSSDIDSHPQSMTDSLRARVSSLFPALTYLETGPHTGHYLGDVHVTLNEGFFGVKTELVGIKEARNYQYHIVNLPNGSTMVLPGKFSLCFSLAVNVAKHFGVEPSSLLPVSELRIVNRRKATTMVARPVHYELVRKFVEQTSHVRAG